MLPIPFGNPATYAGHSGVDFAQPRGTIFRASGSGVVGRRSSNARGGNLVWVDYDGYPGVAYAHLDDYRDSPPVGSRVREGDVLGHVGNSGHSTGPHLHVEVYGNATTAGFWRFFTAARVVGAGSAAGGSATLPREWDEMASKQEIKEALDELLNSKRLGPGGRNLFDSLKFEAGMIADVAKTVNAIRADVNYIHQVSPWSLKAIREAASDGRVSLTDEQARAIAGQLSSVAVESLEAALADDFEGVKARIAALPGETIAALKAAL